MQQAVGLSVSNAPGITGGTGTIQWTDFDISDFTLDEIESTHQGTYTSGTAAYRTYAPSLLKTAGSIRLTFLYDNEVIALGTATVAPNPMTLKLERGLTDVGLISAHVFLKSFSLSGTLGDRITAEVEFKCVGGTITFGGT